MEYFWKHSDTFLLGLISWVIIHVFSMLAFPVVFRGKFEKLNPKICTKFHPKFVSAVFSVIILCYAWPIVFSESFKEMRENDPLLGYNAYASGVYSLALSYFVYDVAITLYNRESWEFLAHAFLCMLVYAQTFKPFMTYHGAGLLMFEASTPFLHVRWFMLQLGFGGGLIYKFTLLIFAVAFFISRIVWGFYLCIQGLIFLQNFKEQVGLPVFYFTHIAEFGWDFFPSAMGFLQEISISLDWKDILHPCENQVNSIELIRNPYLLPFQICGCILSLFALNHHENRVNNHWWWAYVFYLGMNVSSFFCHNLYPRQSIIWNVSFIFDVTCTGASAMSLVLAGLQENNFKFCKSGPINVLTFVIFTGIHFYSDYFYGRLFIPWIPEIIYPGTLLLATIVWLPKLLREKKAGWNISLLGLIFVLLAIPLDPWLCSIGSQFLAIHLIFFGCSLCFSGFYITIKYGKDKVN